MINLIPFSVLLVWKDDDLKLLKLVIEAKTNSMSERQTTYFDLVIIRSNGSYYTKFKLIHNRILI